MEAGTGTVTDAQRDQFDRDGYLVVEDVGIPQEVLDGAIADTKDRYEKEIKSERMGEDGVLYTSHRILDAWKISGNVKSIALNPRVHSILRELYGREPLPFQTLNFKYGSEQRPHSDAMHFNSEPSGFMCGVWLALEDIGPDQGPVVYYPGSHKLEEVTAGELEGDHADYEDFVASVIEREGLREHRATLRRGEALIWSANLIHGGSPQNDRSLTRWSQVTHYFFEGCRYWKPLATRGGERAYWEPTWVR